MPREKEAFRDTLQQLIERFPDREAITLREAAEILGVDKRTLVTDSSFPTRQLCRVYVVPIVPMARWMAGGCAS